MDIVSSVLNLFSLFCECAATCQNDHSCNLEENLNSLRIALDELKNLRDDVRRRVNADEVRRMTRTNQVRGWLERVEDTEREVDGILEEGTTQVQRRCLCSYCPRNCLATHKLGKTVIKKLAVVKDLKGKGKFDVVADRLLPDSVEELPNNPTMGFDLIFERTWRLLVESPVGIIGMYGMGGVGKTTLMKKINNEFLNRTHEFDVVIWVTVSKPTNIPRIQKEIVQRLGLSWNEERTQEYQAKEILNVLVKKKFVMLLDDIWDRVDLVSLGIPTPDTQNKSKVIFTTRSEDVCKRMRANKIEVECLDKDKAWNLFKENVGEEALNAHPDIPGLAQEVAEKCDGLPLALITVGRTMASKKTRQEWRHAIKVLKKSPSELSGMEDEVFRILMFSYENLPDETIRSCFLYCCLYPEDYSIKKEELIEHWIGEGFIDEFDDMDEAINQGHDIIGSLKVTCLLESGYDEESTVKMHDVIRDLALWIASECGKKKDLYMVRAGLKLNEAPEVEKWSNTERLSLMENEFYELKGAPNCPNLLTLLLQWNLVLEKVYDGFFQFVPALRVLNLSYTRIRELPIEITGLVELRSLDLSNSEIEKLPLGLKNWGKLKCLRLRSTYNLHTIPHGEISMLSSLQVMNLFFSSFTDWEVNHSDGDQCTPSMGELECLKHLKCLGITIETVPVLQRLLNHKELRTCTRYLSIRECQGLASLTLSPSSPPTLISSLLAVAAANLGNMNNLQNLMCQDCVHLKELAINWVEWEQENRSLSNLEILGLRNLPNLNIIWKRSQTLLCFKNLRTVYIEGCDALKDLTWLLLVQSLQILYLKSCKGIEEVIHGEVTTVEEELNTFSRLKSIHIYELPNLKSLCRHTLPFPFMEAIDVRCCPKMNKLSLDANSAKNTLRWIKAEQEWWDKLEWEDETIKSVFQHKFQPIA